MLLSTNLQHAGTYWLASFLKLECHTSGKPWQSSPAAWHSTRRMSVLLSCKLLELLQGVQIST